MPPNASHAVAEIRRSKSGWDPEPSVSPKILANELKELMWQNVGPFRDEKQLASALERIREMRSGGPVGGSPPACHPSACVCGAVRGRAGICTTTRGSRFTYDLTYTDLMNGDRVTHISDPVKHLSSAYSQRT